MAYARSYPSLAHLQTCRLHDEEGAPLCAGYLRRGNAKCGKKATFHSKETMPMCKLHSDQVKTASHCRVFLPCGYECVRLCEWVPLGVQRCEMHEEVRGCCWFLERLPIELRIRIYGYLLPAKEILAKGDDLDDYGLPSDRMRRDRKGISMAICRVNRQIHDEATGFLYGSSVFTIWLEERGIRMCNSSLTALPSTLPGSKTNHALQDYQMQLMLLEQQNKKRLLMARQEQDSLILRLPSTSVIVGTSSGSSSNIATTSRHHTALIPFQTPIASSPSVYDYPNTTFPSLYPPVPQGATWYAPLSTRYFDLIQSFRITISFVDSTPHPRPMRRNQNIEDIPSQEMLYMYSDQLHRIVSRLQNTQRRIYRLEITIRFEKQRNTAEDFKNVQLLLKPFERLCGVQNAVVLCWDGVDDPRGSSIKGWKEEIEPFLMRWKRGVEGQEPGLVPGREWEAYWGLERLMTKIAGHCHGKTLDASLRGQLQGFAELRHEARIVREGGSGEGGGNGMGSGEGTEEVGWNGKKPGKVGRNEGSGEEKMRSIAAGVTATWWEFVEWERQVHAQVGAEIGGLWGVLGPENGAGGWDTGMG